MNVRFLVLCFIVIFCVSCPFASAQLIGGSPIGGDQGWIVVHCNEDGASVSLDGEYKCTTSGGQCSIPVYSTGTPYSGFSVRKSGYIPDPYTGSIPRMPAMGETVDVYATLNPVPPPPQYGSIRVTSSPSGAAIYLNGNYRGITPLTISDISPASYSIEADLSGYRTYTTSVTVYAGQQATVYCPLEKIQSQGSLYVTSTPSDAMIYLDAGYKGRTPLMLSGISSGGHTIELDLSGYYDWKSSVSVPVGGTYTVNANLIAIPSSSTGWISVTSSPAGATVYLDGTLAGQTAQNGVLRVDNVRAGDHTIRVEKSGYQAFITTVNVQVNTVSDVVARLVSDSIPATTGTLSVSSTPSGASVFIDNVLKGVTPISLTDISAGSHQVLLRLEGYQDYTVTQQVNAGAANTIAAALNQNVTPKPTRSGTSPLALVGALACIGLYCIRRWK
jgi:hypothetical protein